MKDNGRIETNSSMACFMACPRKYFYRYELMLTQLDEAKPLRIGRIVHDAISKYLFGMGSVEVEKIILDSFRDGQAELIDPSILSDDENISISCFRRYVEAFGVDANVIEVEKEFRMDVVHPFEMDTLETKVAGKIDGLMVVNGKKWIIEHKTVSSISDSYVVGLTMHPQALTYLTAFPGAVGVAFNLIKKIEIPEKPKLLKNGKSLSIDKRQNTTVPLFLEAIKENGFNISDYSEVLESIRNKEADIVRHWLTYSEEIRTQFELSLYENLKRLEVCALIGMWPMNFHSCSGNYGKCQFFDICSSKEKQGTIETLFRVRDRKHEELVEFGGDK
jgi:CRISPR/Cas system-associated exonuclease Cas4 (RecB family)